MRSCLHFFAKIDMIVLILVVVFVIQGRYLAVAWGQQVHACAQLLVFALEAFVVVMHFVGAIFIVGLLLVLIFRILVTLFKDVVVFCPMKVAGLEGLVVPIGGTLVILFVIVFVVVVVTVAVVAILWLVVLTVCMIMSIAAIVALVVMPCVVA